MSKFNDMIEDFHESSKKWDPVTHQHLDDTQEYSSKSVQETSRGFSKVFGDTWLGNTGEHWVDMGNKDEHDFGRWGGNSIKSAGAVYAGMSAWSAYGAGGATGAEGGAGLGEGAGSGLGEGAGSGLGEGMGEGLGSGYEYIDSSTVLSGSEVPEGTMLYSGEGVDPAYGEVDFGNQNFDNPGNTTGKTNPKGGKGGWQDSAKKGGANMQKAAQQQQQRQQPDSGLASSNVDIYGRDPYATNPYAASSSKVKGRSTARMADLMKRGASNEDRIDAVGVQTAAIQALTKRAEALKQRVAEKRKAA